MDGDHRQSITNNLDFIAENISNLSKLLNLLRQESILTQIEIEEIKSHRSYDAGTELANIICKRDATKFPVFIRCLNESGNEVIAQKLVPVSIDKEKSQQIWFGVTEPNRFYTGREKEMKLLENYWEYCMTNKTFSVVAVSGIGGLGKSELVKNFARWFYLSVGGHCIWVDAETRQSLVESFHSLAEEYLEISLNDHLGKEKNFLQIVDEVFQKLLGLKVLLVFDNVNNHEGILKIFLKPLVDLFARKPPTVLRPFAITTSRLGEGKKYFGPRCNQIDLQVLTKHSAINFFYKSLSLNENPEENINELIERLCERLQFYPLAMQQALAYITQKAPFSNALREAIEDYLNEMEKRSKVLLNYELPQYAALQNISKTTFVTWSIAFDGLQEIFKGIGVHVMNIICFLSPDSIPAHLAIKVLQNTNNISNEENIEIIFEHFKNYSLINSPGMNIQVISVHRLVQEVTRIQLRMQGEFLSTLSGIVRCLIDMLKTEEISLKELVHFQLVWQHLIESKEKTMIEEHRELHNWICTKLWHLEKFRDLLDFSSESRGLVESILGENSRIALRMKYWNGVALEDLGEYSESMEVLKDVYDRQKSTFGEEDRYCLHTARSLGSVHWRLEKYEEALQIYTDELEKSERIDGKEDEGTLLLKHDIAVVLAAQGQLDEALKFYEEVLEVGERLFGVEHPRTLTTKHNIAFVKLEQEDYLEALKEFQAVLQIRERVLGENHPNIFPTKHNIAVIYSNLGRHKESLQLFKEVHQNQVQILGPRHPQTVKTEGWLRGVEWRQK